jgi:DNA-binding Lrp family transcriptional regulator
MDANDLKILKILQDDARTPNAVPVRRWQRVQWQ